MHGDVDAARDCRGDDLCSCRVEFFDEIDSIDRLVQKLNICHQIG